VIRAGWIIAIVLSALQRDAKTRALMQNPARRTGSSGVGVWTGTDGLRSPRTARRTDQTIELWPLVVQLLPRVLDIDRDFQAWRRRTQNRSGEGVDDELAAGPGGVRRRDREE